MLIIPIRTGLLRPGSELASNILKNADLQPGDILVTSSKAIATCEGAHVDLRKLKASQEAEILAQKTGQGPGFVEAVLQETKRLDGKVVGLCPSAILTLVRPRGMQGVILCPNAGMDTSNVEANHAIGWPQNPLESLRTLHRTLNVPIIMTDSSCRPTRAGVTAFALCCAGISPLKDERGTLDIFGKKLSVTREAVADQLAVAANAVMGNAGQSTPAAIIRDHGVELSDFVGWVEGIEPGEDLFREVLNV